MCTATPNTDYINLYINWITFDRLVLPRSVAFSVTERLPFTVMSKSSGVIVPELTK